MLEQPERPPSAPVLDVPIPALVPIVADPDIQPDSVPIVADPATPSPSDTPLPSFALSTDSSRSSLASSSAPSTSILRSSSSSTLSYLHASVSFAPLPPPDPRRRKSSLQLGVAARSRLLHNRRALREQRQHAVPPPRPVWSAIDDGVAADADSAAADEADAPDPLVVLGKLVRGAGRSLWRRVSQKEPRLVPGPVPGPERGDAEAAREMRSGPLFVHAAEKEGPYEEVGGVWEEEVEAASWQRLVSGQLQGETGENARTERAFKRTSTVVALNLVPPKVR